MLLSVMRAENQGKNPMKWVKAISLKRIMDLMVAGGAVFTLSPLLFLIFMLVKFSSPGPAIFWSKRFGKGGQMFDMPKFRTMKINTPDLATDKLENPEHYITPVGKILRKFSLDELPQLWCVVTGKMSLVGPRPALHTQLELFKLRQMHGVNEIKPGLTGLAQISGRDTLTEQQKVEFDIRYIEQQSLLSDIQILFLTIPRVVAQYGISH